MAETLFTDGEGPLVYKDLAQDVTGQIEFTTRERLVPGREFYGALSLYDDYCAEVGMEGYQAGDTLALVVPHLLHHNIDDHDVANEARSTEVINGVEEYVAGLLRDGWNFRIISTAYRPMWNLVGERLNVPQQHIACTELDLNKLSRIHLTREFDNTIETAEQAILPLLPLVKDAQAEIDQGAPVTEVFADGSRYAGLRTSLDNLYWRNLPDLGYRTLEAVSVVGGKRKVEAAQIFAEELEVSMENVAYTGDSITDDKIHEHLLERGGLPVAINGNQYALRHAFAGVATTDMRNVRPLLNSWVEGGRDGVVEFVSSQESTELPDGTDVRYHLLDNASTGSFNTALADHKQSRIAVRGLGTASLG